MFSIPISEATYGFFGYLRAFFRGNQAVVEERERSEGDIENEQSPIIQHFLTRGRIRSIQVTQNTYLVDPNSDVLQETNSGYGSKSSYSSTSAPAVYVPSRNTANLPDAAAIGGLGRPGAGVSSLRKQKGVNPGLPGESQRFGGAAAPGEQAEEREKEYLEHFYNPINDLESARRILTNEEQKNTIPNGVISICVVEANIVPNKKFSKNHGFYVCIKIRNNLKSTLVAPLDKNFVKWNQLKHFFVLVPKSRRHPFNFLELTLIQIGGTLEKNKTEITVGSASFHLHDIISNSPISGIFDLCDSFHRIGNLKLEITFNYGMLGYGYSSQLTEESRSPEELLAYSLFPRIPASDKMASVDGVLLVENVSHPSYIPFATKCTLNSEEELSEQRRTETPYRPEHVAKDLSHLQEIVQKYFATHNRVARIRYLRNYLATGCTKKGVPVAGRFQERDSDAHTLAAEADAICARPSPDILDGNFAQPITMAPLVTEDLLRPALELYREERAKQGGGAES